MFNVSLTRSSLSTTKVGLTQADLQAIGKKAVELMNNRVYSRRSVRPRDRNMSGAGKVLDSLTITLTAEHSITIGFGTEKDRIVAAVNDRRSKWFGLSSRDERELVQYAQQLLQRRLKA